MLARFYNYSLIIFWKSQSFIVSSLLEAARYFPSGLKCPDEFPIRTKECILNFVFVTLQYFVWLYVIFLTIAPY